jgi:hypothetical protein
MHVGNKYRAMGCKLTGFDALPKLLNDEIALHNLAYTAPPPGDDPRPNETTWTVFKKKVDAERARAGEVPKPGH